MRLISRARSVIRPRHAGRRASTLYRVKSKQSRPRLRTLRCIFILMCTLLTGYLLVFNFALSYEMQHSFVGWFTDRIPGVEATQLSGFYSQWGQDRWVAQYLRNRQLARVFVEFGANDGLRHSNTAFFELSLGFTGLCIEPDRAQYELLRHNRPACKAVHAAVGDCTKNRTFLKFAPQVNNATGILRDDSGLSGWENTYDRATLHRLRKQIGPTIRTTVRCQNLNDLLAEAGINRIDYLSADTEGSELEALSKLDWSRYAPTVVQVESRRLIRNSTIHVLGEKERSLRNLMRANGYRLAREFQAPWRLRKTSRKAHKTFDLIFVKRN